MKKKNESKQNLKKVISNNWFILKLSFQAAPFYMVFMIFEAVKQQVLVFYEHTYGIKFVLEAAEFGKPFSVVVNFLMIMFVAWGISFVISGIYQNLVSLKGMPKIEKRLKEMMYAKVRELDLECFDNPDYYNEFVLSISEAEKSILRTHQIVAVFFYRLNDADHERRFLLSSDAPSILFCSGLPLQYTFFFSQNTLNRVKLSKRLIKIPA